MTETTALRLCLKDRDPRGFEFLVKKYRREAFFHAQSILGNSEDAADACQESFARAFMAIPRLQELDHFYPWFYRILRNYCLNMISKRKSVIKYRKVKGREGYPLDHATPSVLLEKKEEQILVWNVLQKLKPENREILVLKYIQDRRYDEISEMLGIPRGTVMSRLYYARKAFREEYLKFEKQTAIKEVDV
jgi:RNA polymerase sigma-70 factor (ECF subfamily)